jgi:Iap family predicted aminopeptidase
MKRRELSALVLVLVVVVGFSLAGPVGAAPPKKNSLLTELRSNIDMDYAWQVLDQVVGFQTSTLGFRAAGSSSAIDASEYVASEMTAMGLSDVKLEKIPLDAWEFHEAWVDVPGLGKIQAASFGGSPGTSGVLTEEIVDVGNGFASDYVGKDVAGKIVIANWIGDDFWVDSMAKEAQLHGAIAIIVTTYASDYGNQPGAIECHDGLYRPEWPPMISISGDDGLKVIAEISNNPGLVVSAYSDIATKLMKDGGFGYNVVGYLPGKNYGKDDDTFVILGDHTDSWFTGGMDDTSGVAATLTLAKALKVTYDKLNMVPDRTIIFTTHEAEEYGILNTYYDWCYGAWYQITTDHTEWVGRTVAYMNFELMGKAGLPLESNCAPELASFVHNVFGQNKPLLRYGAKVTPVPHSWADHWTFTAAGVPGIELETVNAEWDSMFYHNQFDTIANIDPDYLANLFSVFADMTLRLVDLPLVPYNFEVSATNLWGTLTTSDDFSVDQLYPIYEKYGVDPDANMGRAVDAASRYAADVAVLKTKLNKAGMADAAEINSRLMAIEAVLGQTLIAQGVWEQDWYPYQQSANDVIHMNNGIEMLKSYGKGYDVNDGIWELNWVGIIWYYNYMSEANYFDQYSRLCGPEVASWGLQTHLLPAVEIWDEYDGLTQLAYQKGLTLSDLEPLIHSLETKMVDQALHNLDLSFQTMYAGLENVDAQLESLIGML